MGGLQRAEPHRVEHYIGGRFDGSGEAFALIDPVTGAPNGEAVAADAETVDRAVQAAKRALQGPWGDMDVPERCAVLRRIADGIEARFDEFVAAETADTGKPQHLAATIDIPRGIANFRSYADLMIGRAEESYRTPAAFNYTVRKPLGTVAVIAPWNLPLLLMTWKVAPALAAGNTIVAKPSEMTPSTATLLAEVMDEAGLPAGVFNLVHGPGSTGAHLTAHEEIDAIAFTGASHTGRVIMRSAAANLTPVSFELGGKNAALVFADADLEAAVKGTVKSSFTHAGQICLCTERVYVERSVYDEFAKELVSQTRKLTLGRPYDNAVDLGPMVSKDHQAKVLSYYNKASEDGTILTGGGVPTFNDDRDGGFFVQPTVIADLPEDHAAVQEEIFGPVCRISPFDTEEEAVRLANGVKYGLAATVWTQNLDRANRVAPKMDVGIAWVNCWNLRDLRTPFGGVKSSGIGREGGNHSLDFFSEPMNVCVAL